MQSAIRRHGDEKVPFSLFVQTELNLFAASGIPLEKIGTSEKPLLFPTKAHGKSPRELAEAYLAETPFADFLAMRLPLRSRFRPASSIPTSSAAPATARPSCCSS